MALPFRTANSGGLNPNPLFQEIVRRQQGQPLGQPARPGLPSGFTPNPTLQGVVKGYEQGKPGFHPAGAPGQPPAPSTPPGTYASGTADQRDAFAIINEQLTAWGLQSLTGWAWDQITQGASAVQVAATIRDQPAFKQEYGAVIDGLAAKGEPVSPADIINYRNSAMQVAHENGLPDGFMTKQVADQLMIGQVSAAELSSRVASAHAAIYNASPETRVVLNQLYGAGATPGQVASYFLDPSRALPLVQQELAASTIGGRAIGAGFQVGGAGTNAIDQNLLNRLAAQGISDSQAQQGFNTMYSDRQLLNTLPGENPHNQVGLPDSVLGYFGDDPAAQEIIENRRQDRIAQFGDTGPGSSVGTGGVLAFAQSQ